MVRQRELCALGGGSLDGGIAPSLKAGGVDVLARFYTQALGADCAIKEDSCISKHNCASASFVVHKSPALGSQQRILKKASVEGIGHKISMLAGLSRDGRKGCFPNVLSAKNFGKL